MTVLSKLVKPDPTQSTELVEDPLPDANTSHETENLKSRKSHALSITNIPLELVEYIVKKLHPLEKFCCYGVSTGMRLMVEKHLPDPDTLGVYISDTTCVVFSDGKFCKYTEESGGCGYGYGTYGKKNRYGHYADRKIPFERRKRIGFLENVQYDKAGLNVFLSVLTKHGNHLECLKIKVKDGYNPNKFVMRIDKKLISLNMKLSVERVDLMCMSPKQMKKIISHLKSTFLSEIHLENISFGQEDNESMREIAKMEQWKNAVRIRVHFPTTIPIRRFLHLSRFLIVRNKMTAREVVNIRNSIFKHQHIREVEVDIHDPNFDVGICRRALGPCIPDPTDPEAGFYQGTNGFVNVLMGKNDDGETEIGMWRYDELPVFQ